MRSVLTEKSKIKYCQWMTKGLSRMPGTSTPGVMSHLSGAHVVGGTNPRKAGRRSTSTAPKLPVLRHRGRGHGWATGADTSVIFVPPAGTKTAVVEAIDAPDPARRGDHLVR